MKFILPLLSVSLILAACMSSSESAPAPQVTPPSPTLGEGAGVRETPPPTETPLPTLTPTPVAVDGIAQDADGNQLAYLNREWLVLPKLDADYAKLMVDGENVVAVDADGEIAFEYDMAAKNWVEVVREPQRYLLGHNDAIRRAMESMQIPEGYRVLNYNDGINSEVPMGDLGPSGDGGNLFSGVLLKVVNLKDYDARFKDEARGVVLAMVLPDQTEVKILLRVSTNPPK